MNLRYPNSVRQKKNVFKPKLHSTTLWRTSSLNRRTDKSVFLSFKSAFKTKRPQCHVVLSVNAKTLRLLKLQLTKTRTPLNLTVVRIYIHRSFGTLICAREWKKKCATLLKLTKHLRILRLQLRLLMCKKWLESSLQENKPTVHSLKQWANQKVKLTTWKNQMKN